MLPQLSAHLTEIKLTLAALVGFAAYLADASADLDVKGWEELGLKGILLFAVYYIGKLFLDSQKAHKAEQQDTWAAHKADAAAREAKLLAALDASTQTGRELLALTKEQTDYFKAVTRNIVDERLKSQHGSGN